MQEVGLQQRYARLVASFGLRPSSVGSLSPLANARSHLKADIGLFRRDIIGHVGVLLFAINSEILFSLEEEIWCETINTSEIG